jgi:hypothetical protein
LTTVAAPLLHQTNTLENVDRFLTAIAAGILKENNPTICAAAHLHSCQSLTKLVKNSSCHNIQRKFFRKLRLWKTNIFFTTYMNFPALNNRFRHSDIRPLMLCCSGVPLSWLSIDSPHETGNSRNVISWHNKTKVPSCTRWRSLDFNYDKIEERKKANKKLQDIDLTGSWELDQVPSFHDYCTYDDPKTKTSKQGNICNKQARGSWFISLTHSIFISKEILFLNFFLPTNRYQLLFLSDDNQESVSKMMWSCNFPYF